jgi:hypothetical protein
MAHEITRFYTPNGNKFNVVFILIFNIIRFICRYSVNEEWECTIVGAGGDICPLVMLPKPLNRIWVRRAVSVYTESCAANFILVCLCRLYHVTSKVNWKYHWMKMGLSRHITYRNMTRCVGSRYAFKLSKIGFTLNLFKDWVRTAQ